jgi:cytochrome b6-f complex iron-sulfur subunit
MSDPNTSPTGSAATPAVSGAAATAPSATAPAKPAAAKPPAKGKGTDRRFFLFMSAMAVAWITFTATMVSWFLYTLRFLMPNVLSEPPSKVKVGFPDAYDEGKVVDRFKDANFWIVRNDGKIYALSTTCTHLGCTPNWLEKETKFKCPCHGSGFYISGINFEGPAPRPLERWGISVGDDGQLVVDKSKKFQQERGEWSNPESFIKV